MTGIIRKVRALLGVGLTWGALWAAVAVGLVATALIVNPDSVGPGEGPLVAAAIIGFQGFIAGLVFGTLLSFAEVRKTILDLSLPRVGLWGLVASAALPLITGMPTGMLPIVCILGAISAAGSVAIARRPLLRHPGQHQLPIR